MSGVAYTGVTPAQFVADFPLFADQEKYPPSSIATYLSLAFKLLNPARFADLIVLASELYAAHYLTLDAQDERAAASGGLPGQTAGQVTNKSVGGASIAYDASGSLETDAGAWNLTTYGKRLYRLIKLAGMGGAQVTGATTPLGSPFPGTIA